MIKKSSIIFLGILLLMPLISFAAASDFLNGINPGNILPGTGNDTFGQTLLGFVRLFLQIVGLIAVAYIIYGGFRYVTAGGNDDTTTSARRTITNAIIGLVVVILSYVIVTVVTNAVFGRLI